MDTCLSRHNHDNYNICRYKPTHQDKPYVSSLNLPRNATVGGTQPTLEWRKSSCLHIVGMALPEVDLPSSSPRLHTELESSPRTFNVMSRDIQAYLQDHKTAPPLGCSSCYNKFHLMKQLNPQQPAIVLSPGLWLYQLSARKSKQSRIEIAPRRLNARGLLSGLLMPPHKIQHRGWFSDLGTNLTIWQHFTPAADAMSLTSLCELNISPSTSKRTILDTQKKGHGLRSRPHKAHTGPCPQQNKSTTPQFSRFQTTRGT